MITGCVLSTALVRNHDFPGESETALRTLTTDCLILAGTRDWLKYWLPSEALRESASEGIGETERRWASRQLQAKIIVTIIRRVVGKRTAGERATHAGGKKRSCRHETWKNSSIDMLVHCPRDFRDSGGLLLRNGS